MKKRKRGVTGLDSGINLRPGTVEGIEPELIEDRIRGIGGQGIVDVLGGFGGRTREINPSLGLLGGRGSLVGLSRC